MQKTELAYLAGVMDSDGWFSIKKSTNRLRNRGDVINPSYHIRIGCKQVKTEAVTLLFEVFGGYRRIDKPTAVKGKPLHSWSATDLKAETAVRALLPYLRIKKHQALLLLQLRRLKSKGRKGTFINSHKLRWGRPTTFRNRCYSPEQVAEMERLYIEVRTSNDTRWIHQTKM